MDAPGLPGCFPRFFFFFSTRSAARRCLLGGFRPGRSSELGGIEEFPLFRDPARSAVSSCSRRPATTASSAAICSACAAISCACSRISASRGSADGSPRGASVTARNHPGNHAHPPRQHHARRWNVTHDYPPQHRAQGPECLPRRPASSVVSGRSYSQRGLKTSTSSSCDNGSEEDLGGGGNRCYGRLDLWVFIDMEPEDSDPAAGDEFWAGRRHL